MASSALEEKINKIRQQNEEIKRRYEEVEEDKKNAAKLNALVQMVPSTDWPERKEPPEFSNPPKTKPKITKEKHEYTPQFHPNEGKKVHSFAQGEGPPPDPKYNFLADSEREPSGEYTKETSGNRSHHKATRGSFRKKTNGRETNQKDGKPNKGNYRDDTQPGYDAWRAERNRIDEDRISRQRTAEGNWRREWDNDKVHIIDDTVKKVSRPTLGDFAKKDSDRRHHANNNEHANYNRGGGHRPPHRGSSKNFYSNYDNRSHSTNEQPRNGAVAAKAQVSPTSEERTVVATEKSLKVTVNQSNTTKAQVMSIKVNSPSIAGTGRVGPRQRTRVTYSQWDADSQLPDGVSFLRQKSFEDKSKGTYFSNQKLSNLKRSHSQKKKENETKYNYHKRDGRKEDIDVNSFKHVENEFRSYPQKDHQRPYATKTSKPLSGNIKATKDDSSDMDVTPSSGILECSTSTEINSEYNPNATIENNETRQATEPNKIKTANGENEQASVNNEIANEASAQDKTADVSATPISNKDNSEDTATYDTNKSSFDNGDGCSEAVTNNETETALQEISNTSSETLVPNNIKLNEEIMQNEGNTCSNQETNNVKEHEVPSNKDDGQSSKNDTKEFVIGDCDNIEGEAMAQRSAQGAVDKSTPSLVDETNSVIENNNQSVCNNASVQGEKESNERKEPADEEVEAVNSNEKNAENTLNQEKVDAESVEESMDKIMQAKKETENGEAKALQ